MNFVVKIIKKEGKSNFAVLYAKKCDVLICVSYDREFIRKFLGLSEFEYIDFLNGGEDLLFEVVRK